MSRYHIFIHSAFHHDRGVFSVMLRILNNLAKGFIC